MIAQCYAFPDMKLILTWLLHAIALLALTRLYSGVQVSGFGAALAAAFVIGLFNLIMRPALVVLSARACGYSGTDHHTLAAVVDGSDCAGAGGHRGDAPAFHESPVCARCELRFSPSGGEHRN